jgi:hypothetical protein
MPRAANKIPENIDFAAQELLEAPAVAAAICSERPESHGGAGDVHRE